MRHNCFLTDLYQYTALNPSALYMNHNQAWQQPMSYRANKLTGSIGAGLSCLIEFSLSEGAARQFPQRSAPRSGVGSSSAGRNDPPCRRPALSRCLNVATWGRPCVYRQAVHSRLPPRPLPGVDGFEFVLRSGWSGMGRRGFGRREDRHEMLQWANRPETLSRSKAPPARRRFIPIES